MKTRIPVCGGLLLVLMARGPVFSQTAPPPPESHKYRVILSTAGAGGAFTLGVFGGLVAFDDARYATRKVWTTALIAAAGGAVGGYFIGRAIDRSGRNRSAPANSNPWVSDQLDRSLTRARLRLLTSQHALTGVPALGLRLQGGGGGLQTGPCCGAGQDVPTADDPIKN